MSEKVGGAEGTKLDEDFKEMERVRRKTRTITLFVTLPCYFYIKSTWALDLNLNNIANPHKKALLTL